MPVDLEENRIKSLLKSKNKSEETHEKNLTYITAGALGVSLSFIPTIFPLSKANHVCILISAWIVLLISLIVNLLTHKVTADFSFKKLNEFYYSENDKDGKIEGAMKRYSKRLAAWNWIVVGFLIVGLGFIVTFCMYNI